MRQARLTLAFFACCLACSFPLFLPCCLLLLLALLVSRHHDTIAAPTPPSPGASLQNVTPPIHDACQSVKFHHPQSHQSNTTSSFRSLVQPKKSSPSLPTSLPPASLHLPFPFTSSSPPLHLFTSHSLGASTRGAPVSLRNRAIRHARQRSWPSRPWTFPVPHRLLCVPCAPRCRTALCCFFPPSTRFFFLTHRPLVRGGCHCAAFFLFCYFTYTARSLRQLLSFLPREETPQILRSHWPSLPDITDPQRPIHRFHDRQETKTPQQGQGLPVHGLPKLQQVLHPPGTPRQAPPKTHG